MTYFAGVTRGPNTPLPTFVSPMASLAGSLLLLCSPGAVEAATPDEAPSQQTVPEPGEAAGSADEAVDQCDVGNLADPAWVDRMRLRLSQAACASSAWFDGFFGTERRYEDYRATYGSVSLGTLWDERDGFDPRLRFRIRLQLPQADERLNAFIGRVDREEFVTGREEEFDALPSRFGQEDEDELLLGLGWSSPDRRGSWFDSDVGVKIALPLDPYVRGSWKLVHDFSKSTLLRLRESAFWRNTEGFGVTSRADLDYVLEPGLLSRWTAVATYSEESLGVDWYTTLTLFQSIDEIRAFAYQVSYSGETDREVPIKDWGVQLIYRQRISREWLFVELRSSVTWPKDEPQEPREPNWGVGIAIEMLFGDRLRARQLERLQEIEETR